jgi:hypothetical protein
MGTRGSASVCSVMARVVSAKGVPITSLDCETLSGVSIKSSTTAG